MIRVKRIYDPPRPADGYRILVDRLWPRGISKAEAKIDLWCREIAPSGALRKWFAHIPGRWASFQQRYRKELKAKMDVVRTIKDLEKKKGTVTLVYAAADEQRNNAIVLPNFLRSVPAERKPATAGRQRQKELPVHS
jgi:uncharacterized protein YeaO (DUF488 family)